MPALKNTRLTSVRTAVTSSGEFMCVTGASNSRHDGGGTLSELDFAQLLAAVGIQNGMPVPVGHQNDLRLGLLRHRDAAHAVRELVGDWKAADQGVALGVEPPDL